eukprot:363877-Chlamydomonas_euryale.AAC.2
MCEFASGTLCVTSNGCPPTPAGVCWSRPPGSTGSRLNPTPCTSQLPPPPHLQACVRVGLQDPRAVLHDERQVRLVEGHQVAHCRPYARQARQVCGASSGASGARGRADVAAGGQSGRQMLELGAGMGGKRLRRSGHAPLLGARRELADPPAAAPRGFMSMASGSCDTRRSSSRPSAWRPAALYVAASSAYMPCAVSTCDSNSSNDNGIDYINNNNEGNGDDDADNNEDEKRNSFICHTTTSTAVVVCAAEESQIGHGAGGGSVEVAEVRGEGKGSRIEGGRERGGRNEGGREALTHAPFLRLRPPTRAAASALPPSLSPPLNGEVPAARQWSRQLTTCACTSGLQSRDVCFEGNWKRCRFFRLKAHAHPSASKQVLKASALLVLAPGRPSPSPRFLLPPSL